MVPLRGLTEWRFLINEVPLYCTMEEMLSLLCLGRFAAC